MNYVCKFVIISLYFLGAFISNTTIKSISYLYFNILPSILWEAICFLMFHCVLFKEEILKVPIQVPTLYKYKLKNMGVLFISVKFWQDINDN